MKIALLLTLGLVLPGAGQFPGPGSWDDARAAFYADALLEAGAVQRKAVPVPTEDPLSCRPACRPITVPNWLDASAQQGAGSVPSSGPARVGMLAGAGPPAASPVGQLLLPPPQPSVSPFYQVLRTTRPLKVKPPEVPSFAFEGASLPKRPGSGGRHFLSEDELHLGNGERPILPRHRAILSDILIAASAASRE